MNPTCRAPTLRVSERFVTIACIRRITLHPVIHSSDLDDGGTLLQLHDGSFLARLVVRVKRAVALDAVDLDRVVTPGALVILPIRIVDRATLTGNTHDLRLVARPLQIRVHLHLFRLLTPLIFCIFVYFI